MFTRTMAASQEKALTDGAEPTTSRISFWRMIFDSSVVTDEMITYPYTGSGTEDDPYAVTWIPDTDPRNPLNFSVSRKWCTTILVSCCTLSVALCSSTYSGSLIQIQKEFGVGTEVAITGLSVFVLGFGVSPC